MMSKIRNLFKKFKKNKSSEEFTGEFELPDLNDEDIEIDIDTEFDHDEQSQFNESLTGEINLGTEELSSHELDLENGKIPFKDKFTDAIASLKASLYRFRLNKPKKLSVQKNDSEQALETKTNIILPASLSPIQSKLADFSKQVNWKNLHNDFFQKQNRQIYHRFFQVAGIILMVYTFGKITGLILKGKNEYKSLNKMTSIDIDRTSELTTTKITTIKNANLFKTQAIKQDTSEKKKIVINNEICKNATKKSSLPIKLINTIVLQDSVKSMASVQVRSSNELMEIRQGEQINSLAKIDRIERLRLIIKNLQDGTCESIENENTGKASLSPIAVLSPKQSVQFKKQQTTLKGIENDGNNFTIDKSLIAEKMENINDILTQARGIQITNPDGSLSFKIVDIQPGGIFSYLGIENNDIITQINGQPITDLNMVMNLFGKITNIDKLNLTIKRAGNEMPLDYKFR